MIRVLGAIQIVLPGGRAVELASTSQRRLLALLALQAPNRARADWLAEQLRLSPSGLRTGLSRLRKALQDDSLVAIAGGYQLRSAVDAHVFSRAVATVEPRHRLSGLEAALALWGGAPYDDFADEAWAVGEVSRLVEVHAGATDDYAAELVAVRRWPDAVATLTGQVARHPLRDRSRGLLLRALAGAGRQADALGAYRDYRALLADELGTEPSPEVDGIARRLAEGWNGTDWDGTERDRQPAPRPRKPLAGFPRSLASLCAGPFAGRSELVTQLSADWQAGRWQSLLVAGEPGIGKSRLLAELARRMHADGRRVALGRCDEDFRLSYRPWTELLDPLAASLSTAQRAALGAGHLGELARILPALADGSLAVPASVRPDARQARLADAIIALLRVVGPVLAVLDDLQWIDLASLRVLRQVLRAALPELTVLAAYRDTDLAHADPLDAALDDLRRIPGVRPLTLDGLDDDAVAHLIGRGADADRGAQAPAIRSRTGGNPLFVQELISHLAAHHDPAELPERLVELIDHRVSRLGAGTVEVLRVAAVAGLRFDVGVLERAVEGSRADRVPSAGDVAVALERAHDAGVIVDDGSRTEFRHAVIRDALLAGMSTSRRRRLHGDLAAALECATGTPSGRRLAEIAHHHDQAGSAEAPRWYLRAASAAVQALDADAVALADRGLALLAAAGDGDATLRCDLLITRTSALRVTGAPTLADARQAADAAVALGDG
jgi:DNA-binding SARP family transcriptional activator